MKIKVYVFTILIICSRLGYSLDRNIINMNDVLGLTRAETLWPYSASSFVLKSSGVTLIPDVDKIVFYDLSKNRVVKSVPLQKGKRKVYLPYCAVRDSNDMWAVVLDRDNGIVNLLKYSLKDESISAVHQHHSPSGLFSLRSQGAGKPPLVVGVFMTNYNYMLERYDEETLTPSRKSIERFHKYYEETPAYRITRYDDSFNVIDSADFIDRRGEDLERFLSIIDMTPSDMDRAGHLFITNQSRGLNVNEYDHNCQPVRTIEISDPGYINIPLGLTYQKQIELEKKAGSFSQVYGLFVTQGKLIINYYSNSTENELPEGPYYYSVTTNEGDLLHLGTLPYPIFCRDDRGGLYLYVHQKSKTLFKNDHYYLVEVSLAEVMDRKISEDFVEMLISSKE